MIGPISGKFSQTVRSTVHTIVGRLSAFKTTTTILNATLKATVNKIQILVKTWILNPLKTSSQTCKKGVLQIPTRIDHMIKKNFASKTKPQDDVGGATSREELQAKKERTESLLKEAKEKLDQPGSLGTKNLRKNRVKLLEEQLKETNKALGKIQKTS